MWTSILGAQPACLKPWEAPDTWSSAHLQVSNPPLKPSHGTISAPSQASTRMSAGHHLTLEQVILRLQREHNLKPLCDGGPALGTLWGFMDYAPGVPQEVSDLLQQGWHWVCVSAGQPYTPTSHQGAVPASLLTEEATWALPWNLHPQRTWPASPWALTARGFLVWNCYLSQ